MIIFSDDSESSEYDSEAASKNVSSSSQADVINRQAIKSSLNDSNGFSSNKSLSNNNYTNQNNLMKSNNSHALVKNSPR